MLDLIKPLAIGNASKIGAVFLGLNWILERQSRLRRRLDQSVWNVPGRSVRS